MVHTPVSPSSRYVIKGELHKGGHKHVLDAWGNLEAAIDTAKAVYGYDRVVVIDAADNNKEVWDSLDVVKQ